MKTRFYSRLLSFVILLLTVSMLPGISSAQDEEPSDAPLEGLPTLFSVRASGGWGIGRARQFYGYNGSDKVFWSTGQGVKMNLALDIPIVPIEVVKRSPSRSSRLTCRICSRRRRRHKRGLFYAFSASYCRSGLFLGSVCRRLFRTRRDRELRQLLRGRRSFYA